MYKERIVTSHAPRDNDVLLNVISQQQYWATDTFSDLFIMGCHMADYQLMIEPLGPIESVDLFGQYSGAMFVNPDGTVVGTASTVAIFDALNNRMAYLVVLWPGKNMIYYSVKPMEEDGQVIHLIADPLVRKSQNIEDGWTSDNVFDMIALSSIFGFKFNKQIGAVEIPTKLVENSFVMAKRIADDMFAQYEASIL